MEVQQQQKTPQDKEEAFQIGHLDLDFEQQVEQAKEESEHGCENLCIQAHCHPVFQ